MVIAILVLGVTIGSGVLLYVLDREDRPGG